MRPKHAQRVDLNQQELVTKLRQVGARVIFIGKPVDLLVGFRGENFLLEVKDPSAKGGTAMKLTAEQQIFFDTWSGQVAQVATIAQAIEVIVSGKKRS